MLCDLLSAKDISTGRFWGKAWSLVDGCTPISPGCGNNSGGGCWLAGISHRFNLGLTTHTTNAHANPVFTGKVIERRDRLKLPKGKPKVYAVWSDLFHEKVSYGFIDDALGVMFCSPHQFIICTKRPAQAVEMLHTTHGSHYPNVTIMVTMENQQFQAVRGLYTDRLLDRGWKVGALCEPLLCEINLNFRLLRHLSWIIAGAETGPHARPCNPDWLRSLRDQAQECGIPFWLKHVSKKDGRTLDGREWSETP